MILPERYFLKLSYLIYYLFLQKSRKQNLNMNSGKHLIQLGKYQGIIKFIKTSMALSERIKENFILIS